MSYSILTNRESEKELARALKSGNKALMTALKRLPSDPLKHAKRLSGELSGCYRLKCPPYRVVFTVDEAAKTVTIIAVGLRDDIYDEAESRV